MFKLLRQSNGVILQQPNVLQQTNRMFFNLTIQVDWSEAIQLLNCPVNIIYISNFHYNVIRPECFAYTFVCEMLSSKGSIYCVLVLVVK